MKAFALCLAACLTTGLTFDAKAQEVVGFDRGSFGQVVLKRNQAATGSDLSMELAVGEYNNESIRNYSSDSVFAKIGLSVGRLDILTDKGVFPCTAFVVDDKHLLTNHHCVPGILNNSAAGATRIEAVQFVAGYTQQGVTEGTRTYSVSPTPVETHEDLDFSVLEVFGNPAATFGRLDLSDRVPQNGDPYWVIGHPMGEAQRISREKCKANTPALSNARLLHTCDTLPGNSGSPVIDASLQKVVGLHHAGSKRDAVNFAIPMRDILQRSSVLTAALQTPQVISGAGADDGLCDALYAEAKAVNQCFAYSAYLQRCEDHGFSLFAQSFVNSQCQQLAVVQPSQPVQPVQPVQPTQPAPAVQPEAPRNLRPWCGNGGLNTTEAAICGDPYLAGLDAELQRAFDINRAGASKASQTTWLRNQRNACGSDTTCIGRAMVQRITALQTAPAQAPARPSGGTRQVAGNYTLSGSCYIVTASRNNLADAQAFARQWFSGQSGTRIFLASNGYYAIVKETVQSSQADWRLSQLKSQGAVPGDSYCSVGKRYTHEIVTGAAAPAPAPAPSGHTMYVDNNSDGALNVRPGPGTNYPYFTEILSGTQVNVLGRSGNWSNVRIPDGREGWVYTPLLTSTKPWVRQCSAWVKGLRPRSQYNLQTGAGFLSVRTKPSTKTGVKIAELYQGDQVRVLARSKGWARVECVSGGCLNPYDGRAGLRGWSSEKYLSVSCN